MNALRDDLRDVTADDDAGVVITRRRSDLDGVRYRLPAVLVTDYQPSGSLGAMLWLRWNMLPGSYFALTAWRRA